MTAHRARSRPRAPSLERSEADGRCRRVRRDVRGGRHHRGRGDDPAPRSTSGPGRGRGSRRGAGRRVRAATDPPPPHHDEHHQGADDHHRRRRRRPRPRRRRPRPPRPRRHPRPEDEAMLLHHARRLTFGPTAAVMAELRSLGTAAWIDKQLDWSKIDESALDPYLASYPRVVADRGPDRGRARAVDDAATTWAPRRSSGRCGGSASSTSCCATSGPTTSTSTSTTTRAGPQADRRPRRHPGPRHRSLRRHARGVGQVAGDADVPRPGVVAGRRGPAPERELRP